MNMLRFFVTLLLCIFFSITVHSQSKSDSTELRSAFGAQLSNISGNGLTYRGKISPSTSLQATGGIFSVDNETQWWLGAEFLYRIARLNDLDAVIGPAAGVYKSGSGTEANLHLGFGLGLEYRKPADPATSHFIFYGHVYYPGIYTLTHNITLGGVVGMMMAF